MAEAADTASISPEGFIDISVVGDQTFESFDALRIECQALIDQLHQQHKPVHVIIDISKQGGYSLGSNKAALQALETTPYEKTAIVGAKGPLEEVTNLIILALGKYENTRMFDDRASAIAWITEKAASSNKDSSASQS